MVKINLPYALTFLSGLLLGWLALGWWLWPVAYVGEAYTYELNQADRLRYAQGAVDGFTLTGQVDPAWFAQWTPEEVSQALAQVAAQPNRQAAAYSLGMRLGIAVQAKVVQGPTPVQLTVKLAKAQANQADEVVLPDWLPYLALAVVVVGLVGGGLWVVRSAARAKSEFEARQGPAPTQRYAEMHTTQYAPVHQAATRTLAHAQFTFGPNQPTDQHLPIEQEGVSLGEFGVSQVEGLQAWDVWLFDPKALGTVTKVLSDEVGSALDGRGEFIAWKEPFTLETPNLKMTGMAVKQLEGGLRVDLTVEGKGE